MWLITFLRFPLSCTINNLSHTSFWYCLLGFRRWHLPKLPVHLSHAAALRLHVKQVIQPQALSSLTWLFLRENSWFPDILQVKFRQRRKYLTFLLCLRKVKVACAILLLAWKLVPQTSCLPGRHSCHENRCSWDWWGKNVSKNLKFCHLVEIST